MPIIKQAAAIITDQGRRTSYAAIISRELGILVVVGIGNAIYILHSSQVITVLYAEGNLGLIYDKISEITT